MSESGQVECGRMPETMLKACNLHKTYTMGKVKLPVLRGVDLQIQKGEFIGIAGPSGAGKSTLLHLLTGLDEPTEGEVLWKDASLSKMKMSQRAKFRNEAMGIVFQAYHLVPELNALDNVMLPGIIKVGKRTPALRERAKQCLAQVGLAERMAHKPNALSGGELQRTAIARALMNEPEILFCDEPTGNLDSKTGEGIIELLLYLQREKSVALVLVTHQQELAERAERLVLMQDGIVVDKVRLVDPS